MKTPNATTPPKQLSLAARRHWARITAAYEMTPDSCMTLEVALTNWDLASRARVLLREQGIVLNGRRHPAIEIAKQGDALFMRAMRELGLNISDPGEVGRPPESLGAESVPANLAQEELF